ncbi:MAG: adenylate/guanylate cyclase domain-containing protein, partial [Burkholderiaceae bacterium]
KDSVNFKEATISDPYIFASSGELGITVAAPALANGHTIGVIGVDLTLKTLSEFLSNHRVTPNSVTIIADEFGGVVAHPQFELGLTKKGDEIIQNRLEKLNDYRVLGALAERLRTKQDRVVFHAGADNAEYLAIFSPFPKNFKKPWELLIITPTNDFIGELKRTNRYLMTFGLIALLVQLLLINRLARAISRPMELLESDVANIREFRFDKLNNVQSSVTEVKYLSESIYLLARALESFTSYVPRGLVRKLVESGMGTKLGVESRYLTMFFTDLEGFSSLAETEPSQLLLQRISDYFSTVTKAIERESGTVDKFIGDAVMAFWGAPLRHDQHAYAACVAAVRSQRGLAHLNAAWAKENLPPLKLRIGIHSDAVLVGNIGSVERISYTVMGDGVNVAARLEGINKEMGTWTCVSHNVFREAGERLWLRPIDTVTVKGRKGELLIYELLAIRDGDAEVAATQDEIALCELTIAAYAEYANGNWENAISAYTKVLDQYPHDPVAQRMLEKSRARIIKTAA